MTDAFKPAKALVRQEMKAKVAAMTDEEKARQSAVVKQKLLRDKAFVDAKSVSVYINMGDEIQTLEILGHILDSGKRCYIPRYFNDGRQMQMVRLKDWADYESLPLTKWNIKQPKSDELREEALSAEGGLDMVLCPGVAFTVDGKRCGRGKGYYDTYLEKCRKHKPFTTVALAFREQVLDDLPVSQFDFILDKVLYDDGH